jgi:hypothetical protein
MRSPTILVLCVAIGVGIGAACSSDNDAKAPATAPARSQTTAADAADQSPDSVVRGQTGDTTGNSVGQGNKSPGEVTTPEDGGSSADAHQRGR